MCGITGFMDFRASSSGEVLTESVRAMALTLRHRGPDDSGEWVDPQHGLALGFRRLSIIDVSPAGHQPMTSDSGRYVIVINGEVYNFEDIRAELVASGSAPAFRGHSDTEVVLAAFEAWGIQAAVKRFVGMFAFAVWDRDSRQLSLARDRVGVKPLYYGVCGRSLLFGSELKALSAHDAFEAEINRDALALFMRYNYVPQPYSIYNRIMKLAPGTIVTIGDGEVGAPVPYWSARDAVDRGIALPFSGSVEDAENELDSLLRQSIGLRMVADVPLGVFLSGGIDSSTVVAIMQALSAARVKTFTIGFGEAMYNEADHASGIARYLGTDHTELYVTAADALQVIPKLAQMFDEPFADSSQIPTYLVSELARRHVTVSLSGDGGDELFGGYNRYMWTTRLWRRFGWIPLATRSAGARLLTTVSPHHWDALLRLMPSRTRRSVTGDRVHKFAALLSSHDIDEMYLRLASHWNDPDAVVIGASDGRTGVTHPSVGPPLEDATTRMMYLDLITYLPDDILVKVDRASMSVSLEAREPLLDHRLIEFAWSLPQNWKVRNGVGKWLLRRVLSRYLPTHLVDRPKMGFGVPIDRWLRRELRDWAEDLLAEESLKRDGFFHPAPIRLAWAEHLSGSRNWQYPLWGVLMFQAWLRAHE